jgi:molybdenum cofactor guanylyltransferase
MGRPKATITIHGLTLIERLAVAVGAGGLGEPIVVGGESSWAGALRWAPDLYPGEGPLGGLLSAFHSTTASAVFLLACDLVTPDRTVLAHLAARFREARTPNRSVDVLVPVGERREVIHAIYARSIQPCLQKAFEHGTRSLERAIEGANVVELRTSDLPGLSISLQDADTPDVLAPYLDKT